MPYAPVFKALIFDLDGTLVDTIADVAASMNTALSARGYPTLEVREYRKLVGWGLRALARASLPADARDEATVEACYVDALAAYRKAPAAHSVPYPGIKELLTKLAELGLPCAVLSNKADPLVKSVVDKVLPEHDFRILRGELPGYPHKPDPTSALEVAAALGAEAKEILYLGDSGVDMQTAKAAGFFAVGAAWGFRDREELARDGADAIIDRPLDLLSFLNASASWLRID